MMKESAKKQFKLKFWYVTVLLNGVILFYALVIISMLLIPAPYKYPLSIISLALALLLTFLFRKRYFEMKEWLSNDK